MSIGFETLHEMLCSMYLKKFGSKKNRDAFSKDVCSMANRFQSCSRKKKTSPAASEVPGLGSGSKHGLAERPTPGIQSADEGYRFPIIIGVSFGRSKFRAS